MSFQRSGKSSTPPSTNSKDSQQFHKSVEEQKLKQLDLSAEGSELTIDAEKSNVVQQIRKTKITAERQNPTKLYERTRDILQEYNLDLNLADWGKPSRQQPERVYKPLRMRVRYTCHECRTAFGHNSACVGCAHPRCRKCPRYPSRKKRSKESANTTSTQLSIHTGVCHECQTILDTRSPTCINCNHMICIKCLTETVTEPSSIPVDAKSTNPDTS